MRIQGFEGSRDQVFKCLFFNVGSEIFVVHLDPWILDPLTPLRGSAVKVLQHTQPPFGTFFVKRPGQHRRNEREWERILLRKYWKLI